jgi:hypothetical protein
MATAMAGHMVMNTRRLFVLAGLLVAAMALPAVAQVKFGPGLATKYAGDNGIEKDPRVLFVEQFEEPTRDALKQRWEAVRHPEIMSFATDVPAGSGGGHSLLMTHVGSKGDGGHLYRRLSKGHEQVFARFYVKFDPDCAPVHHFGTYLIDSWKICNSWLALQSIEEVAADVRRL